MFNQVHQYLIQSERSTYLIQFSSDNAIASFLGAHLAGIGRAGVAKMFWAMNIAPPVKEDRYEEINRKLLLSCIKKFPYESMQAAICKHFCKEIACFYFILCYFL